MSHGGASMGQYMCSLGRQETTFSFSSMAWICPADLIRALKFWWWGTGQVDQREFQPTPVPTHISSCDDFDWGTCPQMSILSGPSTLLHARIVSYFLKFRSVSAFCDTHVPFRPVSLDIQPCLPFPTGPHWETCGATNSLQFNHANVEYSTYTLSDFKLEDHGPRVCFSVRRWAMNLAFEIIGEFETDKCWLGHWIDLGSSVSLYTRTIGLWNRDLWSPHHCLSHGWGWYYLPFNIVEGSKSSFTLFALSFLRQGFSV